jgi:hypothetical protein
MDASCHYVLGLETPGPRYFQSPADGTRVDQTLPLVQESLPCLHFGPHKLPATLVLVVALVYIPLPGTFLGQTLTDVSPLQIPLRVTESASTSKLLLLLS